MKNVFREFISAIHFNETLCSQQNLAVPARLFRQSEPLQHAPQRNGAAGADLFNGADFLSPAEKFTRVKTVFRRSYIIPFGRSNIDGEERVCRVIVKSKRHQQFMVQNRLQMLNTFAAAEQQ
jgi:hypothetical protein